MTTSKLFQAEMTGAFVGLGIRKQRKVMTETHRDMGAHWDATYLPMHFRRGAGRRYGYKHRTHKTKKRKERLAERGIVQEGGKVDLVWTGLLKRSMLTSHSIRAYPSRVVINMPTTSYVSSRPRDGKRPNMALEITSVAPSEVTVLTARASSTLDKETKKAIVDNRRTKKV